MSPRIRSPMAGATSIRTEPSSLTAMAALTRNKPTSGSATAFRDGDVGMFQSFSWRRILFVVPAVVASLDVVVYPPNGSLTVNDDNLALLRDRMNTATALRRFPSP